MRNSGSPMRQAVALDYADPAAVFAAFADEPWAVFLDSARPDTVLGRFSFICIEPVARLSIAGGVLLRDGKPASGDPFDMLQQMLAARAAPLLPGLPPFQGGAAGFFGYELGGWIEKLPPPRPGGAALPDMAVGIYPAVLAFDVVARQVWLITEADCPPALSARLRQAVADACRQTGEQDDPAPADVQSAYNPRSNFTRADYCAAVARVIDYILAGDIFQANIAQRFTLDLPDDFVPYQFYRRLRQVNAAPFAAYLRLEAGVIASSSPERFLKLADEQVEARPIKGTRPRATDWARDRAADRAIAEALLGSEKDRAENVMIVDLLRNDLSRVCRDGSVTVPTLCGLESYAMVHHLVSVVRGRLRAGLGAGDLLRAAFPGGSITGAPKIRAMQIIAQIEPHPRGPYCGAIGYLGSDGGMDLNIAIRTVTFAGGSAHFHAGGGIVADSDPMAEYSETLDKARAIFAAFGIKPPVPLS